MKKSLFRYISILVLVGALLFAASVVFASNGITSRPCPPKQKKILSGIATISAERKSAYPFSLQSGTFELIRGYIKGACPISLVISSDSEDMLVSCKKAIALTGSYAGFSCRPGGAEKVNAINASTGQWLSNPVIFIGLGYQDRMEINFEAQKADGMNAGYIPEVVDSIDEGNVSVSVFAGL